MRLIAEPAIVTGLWDALQWPARPPRVASVARQAARIARRGWAYGYEVQDFLSAMGLGDWWLSVDLNAFFSLPARTLFNTPRRSSTWCGGGDATSAADVAAMVLMIEQLGLAIDPTPIVEEVLPTLAGKELLTASEIAVLWWKRERHRLPTAWVEVPGAPRRPDRYEPVRLASGYRATAGWTVENVDRIYVEKPSRRRRSAQQARAA